MTLLLDTSAHRASRGTQHGSRVRDAEFDGDGVNRLGGPAHVDAGTTLGTPTAHTSHLTYAKVDVCCRRAEGVMCRALPTRRREPNTHASSASIPRLPTPAA